MSVASYRPGSSVGLAQPVAPTSLPIAIDAMGGDHAPAEIVAGAIDVVRSHGLSVTLVGQASEIEPLLTGCGDCRRSIQVVDAPEIVTMEEHAVAAIRRKSKASITVACLEVAEKRASAIVSAGHSGAVVASAIFTLGRMPGVERPGIAVPIPTALSTTPLYIMDGGGVVDPRPAHIVKFAYLIYDYLHDVVGIESPRIGLLSNGEEAGKGTAFVREVHVLLQECNEVGFIGNIEANAISEGVVDAVLCDGFSGNLLLKAAEGTAVIVQNALRNELTARWYTQLLAAALRPAFRRARKTVDYRSYGGAPLLGVNAPVILAHGRSDRHAIANAILSASRATTTSNRHSTLPH
jgi:glycerol-3-phosphate acyltransferase PlsX